MFSSCASFSPGASLTWQDSAPESSPSYSFSFDLSRYNSEYLQKLRSEFSLDLVIAAAHSDWERVLAILAWVRKRWEHDGSAIAEPNDPISILRSAQEGKRYRCVEYAIVVAGCLEAIGIPCRTLNLALREVETTLLGAGHVANEVYLNDLGKWFFLDGQWNTIPLGAKGIPLSALEFRQALDRNDPDLSIMDTLGGDASDYKPWIHPYLYYLSTTIREGADQSKKRLILLPEGAHEPKIFQIFSPFAPIPWRSTFEVHDFYHAP